MSAHPTFLAFTLLVAFCEPSAGQVISGRLLEASSGRPVRAALVSLVTGDRVVNSFQSDDEGRFRLQAPGPGWYGVRVDALGYSRVNTDTLSVADGESVEVIIRLRISAVPLTPVVVERRAPIEARSQLDRRIETGRRTGLGWFVTRESLDSVSSRTVTGVLTRIPRMTLAHDSLNNLWPVTQSQGDCRPTLYLNGARMAFATGQAIDDVITPDQIEAIEVYRTQTELPQEFTGIDQCAAIVFWTRFGESTSSAPWRFLAGAGAVMGMTLYFLIHGALR